MPTPLQNQWDSRYQSGDTPWDSGKTPPEVTSFWDGRLLSRSGTALDLGCGTGTNIAFLARLGLHAVGVEFSATALKLAAERLTLLEPGLQHQIDLVQADVARLPFTAVDASYILDIGCLHAIPPVRRSTYASGVCNNLASGGYYHLFAFDRHPNPPEDDPQLAWRGMAENEVETLFAPAFEIVDVTHGDPDHAPCRWYLLQKR